MMDFNKKQCSSEGNLSYLITDDEAHMAYNFPLPPLLLEAIITSRADILNSWIFDWPILPEDTALFNFTASQWCWAKSSRGSYE